MTFVVIALVSFLLMEPITALTHRYVMHGVGYVLHRSHHRRNNHGREANDLFPVMFAAIVLVGLAIGFNVPGWGSLVAVGVGVTAYGAAYALVHDAYIHRRIRIFGDRELPVFERLAAAHQVHHARNGAPYGMLLPVLARQSPARAAVSGLRPSHEPVDA